jgi:class 3 adenylate cyclase
VHSVRSARSLPRVDSVDQRDQHRPMDVPRTRYAATLDGTMIAYQTMGEGPPDVVLLRAWYTNLEHGWDDPVLARLMTRLASFGRLIMLDRRGMGLSDRPAQLPTVEARVDDLRSVMDELGVGRAVLVGVGSACSVLTVFAASVPDRVKAVVLFHPPKLRGNPLSAEEWEAEIGGWGTEEQARQEVVVIAPSRADDEAFVRWLAADTRLSASPGMARQMLEVDLAIDVTDVLPSVQAPTLVLAREGAVDDRAVSAEVAALIPGAMLALVPGVDHMLISGPTDAAVDEIERFVTGNVRTSTESNRVLATVLFTDLVDSTSQLSRLGDRAWRDLIVRHDDQIRQLIDTHRGRVMDTAGDGIFAVFDGPSRAVRCAKEIGEALARIGLKVRCGLHTGECEVRGDKLSGLAVVIAARTMSLAGAGEVLVTATLHDLVAGSGLDFINIGEHTLKGVPGSRWIFRLV